MPLFETALVYPGQVIWEGTNVSEGRGTCRPFEIFGAPFINPSIIKKMLASKDIEGCYLQEYYFRPTFNKWKSKLCGGFMTKLPIDLIFGDSSIRPALEAGKKIEQLLKSCSKELEGFLESRKPYLIYQE
jgi:uncharacterized protein YbbC (DUF1343 family)